MSKKKKNVIKINAYMVIVISLLIIILVLSFLTIKRSISINSIKKKYDYLDKLKQDVSYMNDEYDKLLDVCNNNDELKNNNMVLESDISKLENDIIKLQEKISKMEKVK